MDNQLLNFMNGDTNVIKIETIISREITPQGMEYVHITTMDGRMNYNFWHNPNNTKKESQPKNTGGKKPYLMLMVEQLDKLRSKNVSNVEELVGFMVCMGSSIEWGTGKLIHKRSKKPLKYIDLQKMFSGGRHKLDRIIRELRENDLLSSNQEGYFISSELIKKGKKR